MFKIILGAKTPVTTSSMWELLYGRIRNHLSDVMVLVERHPKAKNPLERARVEREILEKFFLLEDCAAKFKKAFMDKLGKGSADTASLFLSMDLGLLSSKNSDPAETLKRYDEIVQRKLKEYKNITDGTIDIFRREEFENIQRAYGLRGYANEIKKTVRSTIDSAAKAVGQKILSMRTRVEAMQKEMPAKQAAEANIRGIGQKVLSAPARREEENIKRMQQLKHRQTAGVRR